MAVSFFASARHAGLMLAAILVWLSAAFAAGAGPHLVVDVKTGAVLTASHPTDRWYPASLTKLMTTYTVLREVRRGAITLQSPVRISAKATEEPPSKLGLPWKTILTVETALKVLMVKSANDVATALGESVGGSEKAFAALMNGYAREIGMSDSHWVNAHGLHNANQYSSARDLALLTIRLKAEFPEQAGLFNIHAIKIGKRVFRNHNGLLRNFAGTTGMKTGFVCAGGVSIVASANLKGRELIAVVLGHRRAKERNLHAAELLTAASRRVRATGLPNLYEWPLTGVPVAPRDISAAVCGRSDGTLAKLETEDEAANYFPIKQATFEEREARYFTDGIEQSPPIALAAGNATGPDPFGLLIDKLPVMLAEEGEAAPESRYELASGMVVAVPVASPIQPQAAIADASSAEESQPPTLSPTGEVVLGGTVAAIPVRRPEAPGEASDAPSDQGN
ncbi:MAG: D-alanyl-D-alanine carboxypeptidase [Nitratireductor sp.]|nr:D-alanyl-D-alanine carboxypeptidase [Nitratireductor sp.]